MLSQEAILDSIFWTDFRSEAMSDSVDLKLSWDEVALTDVGMCVDDCLLGVIVELLLTLIPSLLIHDLILVRMR